MKLDGAIETGTVLLGKYEIEHLLGRGGMGLVYRAHHIHLQELVAIKVLRSDVQLDADAVTRFKREAQAAVKLKSEHVARVHDIGELDDGSPYIVMEFLAGADLGTLVETNGPTDIGTAVDLLLQACDALAEAHASGVVHRDIKPTNLFVTTQFDGSHSLKILDFGISKSATGNDLSLTQTASVLGTPAYMSPEQMRSARRVDARTDIWSLGTVLYELVEGRRPFRAETFSEMCVMAAVDPHDPMTLAPALEPVIARCLAKSPDARYQSIAELAAALAPFARDPQRAAHYVARAQRVLGRGALATPTSVKTPTPPPGSLHAHMSKPVPIPKPPSAPPSDREPGTLSGMSGTISRPSRAGLWIVLVLLLGAAAAAVVLWQKQLNERDTFEQGETIKMSATPPPVPPDAARMIAPDAAIAVTPPDAAAPVEVVVKSPPKKPITKKAVAKKPVAKKPVAKKEPEEVKAPAPPPPPVKKCNVWESRTGC